MGTEESELPLLEKQPQACTARVNGFGS